MNHQFSESQIVFEDNHLFVINKKAGQLVQGDKTGDSSLLDLIKEFIKKETINLETFLLAWFTVSTALLRVW